MKSWVCVDASVVVRMLVYGPLSEQVIQLLKQWSVNRVSLIAPSLLPFEVVSTLRRHVYLKEIAPEEGEEAFKRFMSIPIRLSHRSGIFPAAWRFAERFKQSRAYDTAYLALAELHHCEFWTADRRLYNAARKELSWVNWVGDLSPK